jgi:hypothetical protein
MVLRAGDRVQVAGIRVEYVEDPDSAIDEATIKTPPRDPSPRVEPLPLSRALITQVDAPLAIAAPVAPDLDPAAPAIPLVDDDKTRVVPRDPSLKLRSASGVRRNLAAAATPRPPLPREWTVRVRAIAIALGAVVFAMTALPLAWQSPATPYVALAFAAAFAVVAALIAAILIERATVAHLPAPGSEIGGGPARPASDRIAAPRAADVDLPLQQWPVEGVTPRQGMVARS